MRDGACGADTGGRSGSRAKALFLDLVVKFPEPHRALGGFHRQFAVILAGELQRLFGDGLLKRPLALALTSDGHLLACNAKNGQLVEIDPASGRQLYAQWIDTNPAQSPPGNGDLFGIAMTPDGKGFYYVEDDVNSLMEAVR